MICICSYISSLSFLNFSASTPFLIAVINISISVIQTPPNPTAALPAKALMFGFNCFVGFLFYTPFCFKKLKVKFLENEEKLKQMNELNVQMKKADNLEYVNKFKRIRKWNVMKLNEK